MSKEALYLVHHADLDPAMLADWMAFQAKEHVPLVVKHGGFLGATRFRHLPLDPPKFTSCYRAANLAVVRTYLEGGEVGKMRAHLDDWIAGRRVNVSREILEENYSVDGDGKPLARTPELSTGRAAFVVRVRVDPSYAGTWSVWYDRDHMPDVVRKGSFSRAGRWRIVDEAAGQARFLIVYEAPSADTVAAFRAGPGPDFGKEHEQKFGAAVTVEQREVWSAG